MEEQNAGKQEWKVTYNGGFWSDRGRAGREIIIGKDFYWGEEHWHVPAVYSCTKGLVVDYCIEVDNAKVKAFIEKWDLSGERENDYTERERETIRQEHPLNIDFRTEIECNGLFMKQKQSYGMVWIAESCFAEDEVNQAAEYNQEEAGNVLKHYGYDLKRSWAVRRVSYPWKEKRPRAIKSFGLKLERELNEVYGDAFSAKTADEDILIKNPIDGKEHYLTIHALEKQELDQNFFRDKGMEYPTHFMMMTYTIYPEAGKFQIRDCCRGDGPRRKKANLHGPSAMGVSAVGVISKNDNIEQYVHPDGKAAKSYRVCSSMHFEPVDEVQWEAVFYEKRMPDQEVKLI